MFPLVFSERKLQTKKRGQCFQVSSAANRIHIMGGMKSRSIVVDYQTHTSSLAGRQTLNHFANFAGRPFLFSSLDKLW